MTARRKQDEEFYEAVPGTMQGARYRRERVVDNAEGPERISPLAWIGLAAVILLGLLLLGAVNANRSQQNAPGSGSSSGATTQNYGGPQPAQKSGGAQMP